MWRDNFITNIVDEDLRANLNDGRIQTRFPPEPNGYLHIGHVKSITLNFEIARRYGGTCNIRFDDTNPSRERDEFVEAIIDNVRWLGFAWDKIYYASDYFDRLYQFAERLTEQGDAYVDSLSADDIRVYRGTPTETGRDSPDRNRPIADNIALLRKMRAGEFDEGSMVLRAKIDMAHPNLTMRDPTMYRILKTPHHRAHNSWHIYPMYDFAHCLSDWIEGVTHSLCTLEFKEHRLLYDWFLAKLQAKNPPKQVEFSRLNITHTVLSKRRLAELIDRRDVSGWDDPRMPTVSGMRRRGYPPEALVNFCRDVGITKTESMIDMAHLEHFLREYFNRQAKRVMAVLRPIKLIIENWPGDTVEYIKADNNPEDPEAGSRMLPFGKELYIERDDFMLDPPKKFFRLAPGREVRLKHAYYITCREAVMDDAGNVVELRCVYDSQSKGGGTPDGRKVRGTLHWVSARHAVDISVRLYDRLFTAADPIAETNKTGGDWRDLLNPNSMIALSNCKAELSLGNPETSAYQFLRHGYFAADTIDGRPGAPVFNRAIGLRDSWARLRQAELQTGS